MELVEPLRTKEEIEIMKRELLKFSERDYILFLIGINTGLRVSDILPLKVRDVRGNHIRIVEQKTQKPKKVLINLGVKKALERYIKNKNNNEYLFKSREGSNKPICTSMAYKIIKKAAINCGIPNIGTHTMRKTFGYHLYQKNKDIGALQKIFNHAKPTITLRYIGVEQDYQDNLIANNIL